MKNNGKDILILAINEMISVGKIRVESSKKTISTELPYGAITKFANMYAKRYDDNFHLNASAATNKIRNKFNKVLNEKESLTQKQRDNIIELISDQGCSLSMLKVNDVVDMVEEVANEMQNFNNDVANENIKISKELIFKIKKMLEETNKCVLNLEEYHSFFMMLSHGDKERAKSIIDDLEFINDRLNRIGMDDKSRVGLRLIAEKCRVITMFDDINEALGLISSWANNQSTISELMPYLVKYDNIASYILTQKDYLFPIFAKSMKFGENDSLFYYFEERLFEQFRDELVEEYRDELLERAAYAAEKEIKDWDDV